MATSGKKRNLRCYKSCYGRNYWPSVWKNTLPWQRSYIIRKIADLLRKKQDVLAKWLTIEVGKPLAEGIGETGGAADIFEWNAEETKRIISQLEL